jgi:hypothetical protein
MRELRSVGANPRFQFYLRLDSKIPARAKMRGTKTSLIDFPFWREAYEPSGLNLENRAQAVK